MSLPRLSTNGKKKHAKRTRQAKEPTAEEECYYGSDRYLRSLRHQIFGYGYIAFIFNVKGLEDMPLKSLKAKRYIIIGRADG